MRIEMDAEHDLLYIELRAGEVERTEDPEDGVHVDLDTEDRVLGLEFLSIGAFDDFVKTRDLPENPIEWLRNGVNTLQMLPG